MDESKPVYLFLLTDTLCWGAPFKETVHPFMGIQDNSNSAPSGR